MMKIKPGEWPEILDIYRKRMPGHFPANEIKPEAVMERMFRDGCYEGFLCRENEELIGYAFFFRLPGEPSVLLDFLALEAAYRGQKRGSRFLAEIKDHIYSGRDIFLEIDDPDYAPDEDKKALWLRRREFYQRLGAVDTGLRTCIWNAPYQVLCMPAETVPEAAAVRTKIDRFYREMYGRETYEKDIVIR